MRLLIGIYGEGIGWGLIILVTLWDCIISGVRGFFEYGVGWHGIVLIWLGLILVRWSKYIVKHNAY